MAVGAPTQSLMQYGQSQPGFNNTNLQSLATFGSGQSQAGLSNAQVYQNFMNAPKPTAAQNAGWANEWQGGAYHATPTQANAMATTPTSIYQSPSAGVVNNNSNSNANGFMSNINSKVPVGTTPTGPMATDQTGAIPGGPPPSNVPNPYTGGYTGYGNSSYNPASTSTPAATTTPAATNTMPNLGLSLGSYNNAGPTSNSGGTPNSDQQGWINMWMGQGATQQQAMAMLGYTQ